MASIAEVDDIYRNVAQGEIRLHPVADETLRGFSVSVMKLIRALGDDAGDRAVMPLLSWLRRFRFSLSATPLSPRHLADHCVVSEEPLGRLALRALVGYSRHDYLINDAVERAQRLTEEPASGLNEAMLSLVDQTKASGIALCDPRFVDCTRKLLDSSGLAECEALSPRAIRNGPTHDELIVIGAASWHPTSTFTSPRAAKLQVLAHSWILDGFAVRPLLPPDSAKPTQLTPRVHASLTARSSEPRMNVESLDATEFVPTFDIAALLRHVSQGASEDEESSTEPARLFRLDQGHFVFLSADADSRALLITEDDEGKPYVRHEFVRSIREDDYLVLRTRGAADFVREIADSLLGPKAGGLRAQLNKWKAALRDRVRQHGLDGVARQLRSSYQVDRATPGNVRRWLSDVSIAARDRADLNGILSYVVLSDAEEHWYAVRALRAAHHVAGSKIRRMLIGVITAANFAELEREGTFDFELEAMDAGKLTAFRVLGQSEATHEVPRNRLGRPYQLESVTWLG